MNNITPILGIQKIISQYSTLAVGFDGVIFDGKNINFSAIKALINAKNMAKNILLISNSSLRITDLIKILKKNNVPLSAFSLIMTAGEIVHFLLKNNSSRIAVSGKKYYKIGEFDDNAIMSGLDFEAVTDLNVADFLFVGGMLRTAETIENYRDILELANSLQKPMLCIGNDINYHINGEICYASGALAEQYAMMGGKIMTFGKPDNFILRYVTESLPILFEDILVIGDNLSTDIKMANISGLDSVLITKGVHKELLGDGYIPDLQRAKDLCSDYMVYPRYLLSELRW